MTREGEGGLLRDHVAVAARLRAPGRHAEMEWPRGMSLSTRRRRASGWRPSPARTRSTGVRRTRTGHVLVGKEAEGRPSDVLAGRDKLGRRKEDKGRPPDILAGQEIQEKNVMK